MNSKNPTFQSKSSEIQCRKVESAVHRIHGVDSSQKCDGVPDFSDDYYSAHNPSVDHFSVRSSSIGLTCALRVCLFFLPAWGLWTACLSAQDTAVDEVSEAGEDQAVAVVTLAIDFGDGFEKHYTQLPYAENMTVLDALRVAERHPRGIRLKYRGSGETAFVFGLDDAENQGAKGRNWMYRVNDDWPKKSCGITTLKPGDAILWRFRKLD